MPTWSDRTKSAFAIAMGLFGIIGCTWGAANTITEVKLRAVLVEAIREHDHDPNAHAALTARYPSPSEHARDSKNISDLIDEFRVFKDKVSDDLETLSLGQARIEGRLRGKAIIRNAMPPTSGMGQFMHDNNIVLRGTE